MESQGITVGLDFSEPALNALAEARRLARLLGVRIEIVYVAENDSADADQARARMVPYGDGRESLTIKAGVPWIELTRCVRARKPVMLVIGSHGRAGYHRLAPGSTAARLAASAPCPVLIVGPPDPGVDAASAVRHASARAEDQPDTGVKSISSF